MHYFDKIIKDLSFDLILFEIGLQCMRSVQIRSFSGTHFPAFGLDWIQKFTKQIYVFSPNAY